VTIWRGVVAVSTGFGVALAAAAGAADGTTFEGRLDVVQVEIPVEVRERDGTAVRGLTAADFRVRENGREVPIEGFEVLDYGPPPEGDAAPAVVVSHPRRILLLFDLSFATPISVTRARQAARDLVLAALGDNDLVAVATLSAEHGPRLLVTFTPDRAQVARAVDGLSFDDTREARAVDPLRFMVPMSAQGTSESIVSRTGQGEEVRQDMASAGFEHFRVMGEAFERSSRRMDSARVVDWSRGFAELARHLAAVDGRKQILFFSEGFDGRLLVGRSDFGEARVQEEDLLLSTGEFWRVDNDLRFGNSELLHETQKLLQSLERSDCVVHAIDVGGLRAGGEGTAHGRSRGEESLFFLANESGGRFFGDTNDFTGQARDALQRSAAGYLLTVAVGSVPADGAWRRLEVELHERRGRRVTHRAGWFAPLPFPEVHPFERELITADAIAVGGRPSEIGVSVLAAPFRTGEEWVYVPVVLEIDGRSLLAGMRQPTRVDIYAYATTVGGEFRTFFHRELNVDPEQLAGARGWEGIKYYGHLRLAPEDYQIRVLVRESGSGRFGLARFALRVPDFTAAPPTLLPPFFLDERSAARWTLLREAAATTPDGAIVYPCVADGEPFIPQALPRQSARGGLPFCLIGYSLGDEELELEAFVDDGERRLPLRLRAEARPSTYESFHQWVGELRPSSLPAGRYRLSVVLRESATGRPVATAESDLQVDL